MSALPKQFVYAQQDILGGTTKTNDLVVVNDGDYKDSGICVGPGGPYNNMRLAYSVNDGAGSITTDTLNVNVEQLFFKNLPSAQRIGKSCNYLVADNGGNVKEGYPQFIGNINDEVGTLKDDIILIKQSLGLPIVKTASIENILSYIAIGLCILFLIILIILLFRIHNLSKRVKKMEEDLENIPTPAPPSSLSSYYYPQNFPPPQMSPMYNPPQMSPMGPQLPSQLPSPIPSQMPQMPQMPPMSPMSPISPMPQMSPMSPMSPISPMPQPMSPQVFTGYRYHY